MADIIKLLPDHVANQIAAGEVVQRPASVVKELLENAIDAGATSIKLIIKDGGKSLIQVVDNGIGMSATDARLSFERHATSKIQSAEDLFNLNTKGFRGEALASIAAIARVDLQTKTANEEIGTAIEIEGSEIKSQEVVATPQGTSLAVKHLFFNIPARRNFLKSDAVELRHITDEFHRVALAHPSIAFNYYNNGSELFNLPESNFRQRIVNIFGKKSNEKLVPVNEDTQVVKVSGFICKSEFAKKSRGEQYFFVNNRFIKSHYLHYAVLAAFEGLIKPGTHPGYFLNLEVDPSSIDINIHPTKTEVKFDDEQTLYAILRSTIKHSLGQFNVAPTLDFDHDSNLQTPYEYKNKNAVLPKVTVDSTFNPFAEETKPTTASNSPSASSSSFSSYKKPSPQSWESLYVETPNTEVKSTGFEGVSFESEVSVKSIFDDTEDDLDTSAITFQLKRKYIVTTIKSGMVVIDQGRAHQRVLYEKFLRTVTLNEGLSQQLLFPIQLSFSLAEIDILKDIKDNLTTMGFVFGQINENIVEINGIPPMVAEAEVDTIFDELMADCQQNVGADGFSQADILSKALCKSLAVKTGDVLDKLSQAALVNDLFACTESMVSPFNKPIYVTITENDIDKKFM